MSDAHSRIGEVLSAAFNANDPPMHDWVNLGCELSALKGSVHKLQAELEAAKSKLNELRIYRNAGIDWTESPRIAELLEGEG